MTINDLNAVALRRADSDIRKFVLFFLPQLIVMLLGLDEDAVDTLVEDGLADVRKAKGHSKLAKAQWAAVYALFVCGYRQIPVMEEYVDEATGLTAVDASGKPLTRQATYATDMVANAQGTRIRPRTEGDSDDAVVHKAGELVFIYPGGDLLTKIALPVLLDRATQWMSNYKLITRLHGFGIRAVGGLKTSRKHFRKIFEQQGDSALKAKQGARSIFNFIVNRTVTDATYTYFVEGTKFEDTKAWDIKPRLVAYEETVKRDKKVGSSNAEKARFTIEQVIEFDDLVIGLGDYNEPSSNGAGRPIISKGRLLTAAVREEEKAAAATNAA